MTITNLLSGFVPNRNVRKLYRAVILCAFVFFNLNLMAQISVNLCGPQKVKVGEKVKFTAAVKKSVSGFAKLEYEIPKGFVAEAGDTKGSVFTFQYKIAKFLWTSLPAEESFTVSFYLTASEEAVGDYVLDGTMHYSPGGVVFKYPSSSLSFNSSVEGDSLADKNPCAHLETPTPAPAPAPTPEPVIVEPVPAPIAEPVPSTPNTAMDNGKTSTGITIASEEESNDDNEGPWAAKPNPSSSGGSKLNVKGRVFLVQIMATSTKKDVSIFKDQFGVQDEIIVHEHEGKFKYMVGNFSSRSQASKKREELKSNTKLPEAFVVEYLDGVRINPASKD